MLFPISDDDRALIRPAYVTYGLLTANVALFLYQLGNPAFTSGFSVIPQEITSGRDMVGSALVSAGGRQVEIPQAPGPVPIYLTLLSAMFMHGGWGHLGGNMLYLWIFGDNVEHRFGHVKFLVFYLLSGLAGSFAQIATDPQSVIPNLGASGAISGILGAYMVLFPRNQVMALFLYRVVAIPAVLVLGLWGVMQVVGGFGAPGETGGVAYAAHIGGFIAGVVAGLLARALLREEPDTPFRDIYQRRPEIRRGLM
jgi:membrane associated rhomboid family serine protease